MLPLEKKKKKIYDTFSSKARNIIFFLELFIISFCLGLRENFQNANRNTASLCHND